MLCDDLVLFRLRSKSSVQSALGLHFFLSNAIGVKTSSKKNLHTSNTTKDAKQMTQPRFVPSGHKNEAQSPCKNLEGRPNCSPKNIISGACETKLGCVLWYLENAITETAKSCYYNNVIVIYTFVLQIIRRTNQLTYYIIYHYLK